MIRVFASSEVRRDWRKACACLSWIVVVCLTHGEGDSKFAVLTADDQIQNTVSNQLSKATAESAKTQVEQIDQIVQDIQRTLKLSATRLELLRIGVAGVVARSQDDSIGYLVRDIERRTKGASPKAVEEIMKGFAANSMPSVGSRRVKKTPQWKAMIGQMLSDEERNKWEKVLEERQAYRTKAIAELVMEKVKDSAALSEDQQDKIRPLLDKAVSDYLPDLMGMYSGDGDDFYVPYAQSLILGIPEKEAKAIIPQGQWKKWESSVGEQGSEWEWIKKRHESRMKGEEQN